VPHVKIKHTNYFRLTAEEDNVVFRMIIGKNVSTSLLVWVEYSTDDGETWVRTNNINNQTVTIEMPPINTNESIIMRGNGVSMGYYYTTKDDYTQIKNNTKKFSVSGLIMTLLKGAFADKNTRLDDGTEFSFRTLFEATKITHADKLIMPPNAVKDCFNSMFKSCSELVSAPLLQALVLFQGSYKNMFNGCSKLNYIKMLAVDLTNITKETDKPLNQWCTGVSANGTFDKNKNATWNVRGVNGIPTKWEVRLVDPEI